MRKAFRHRKCKNDDFYTPYSITKQLLEVEKFTGNVLEPACGNNAIVSILKKNMLKINFIDYFDIKQGYNFLIEQCKYDNIITNPPYSLANEFILKAKELYRKKIAMLLPLAYLHGQTRYKLKIFKELSTVYVFTRYPLLTDSIRLDGKYKTGCVVYAWYIWNKGCKRNPQIKWIDNNKYVWNKRDK